MPAWEIQVDPLPHYRVAGKLLVRAAEFDSWMAPRRRVGVTAPPAPSAGANSAQPTAVDPIVARALRGIVE